MAHTSADPFPQDEVTSIDPSGPRAAHHRMLLRCVLLLHTSFRDENDAAIWNKAVGPIVSVKALTEAIRRSGIRL